MQQFPGSEITQPAMQPTTENQVRRLQYFASGIVSTQPPQTDIPTILQRADEVNAVLRMIGESQTNVVVITGAPGTGKSTLAALLYRRLQAFAQTGSPLAHYFVWLSLGPYATLPDVIAALLHEFNVSSPDFFLLQPEQQFSLLVQALRRPQENAFIVLDQFEELCDPESGQALIERGAIPLFLKTMQKDIGASRLLLTCKRSPYGAENGQSASVRSYQLSHISLPEGVALLQQRNMLGSPQELSLAWQRCAGQAFALVLFSALSTLSGLAPGYLLGSPDYAPLWNGEVILNLITTIYYFLNPVQRTVIRALCLFSEPVSILGIIETIAEENPVLDVHACEHELRALLNLSLVQFSVDEQGQQRYWMHSLQCQSTRAHYLDGSDLGGSPAEAEAGETALAAGHVHVALYYQRVAQHSCPPPEQRRGLQDVEPLLSVVRHLCLGWHWQEAYDLLFSEGLHENLMQWGRWNTLIGLYTLMLPPHGVLTRRDEGQGLSDLGLLYGRLGEYQPSIAYYQQALTIQREIGDAQGQVATLINLGELLRSQSQFQAAHATFEQARHLNEQQSDPLLESILLHNLGLVYQAQKAYTQALHCYLESLQLAQHLQAPYNEGMILTNSGMLLCEQGYLPEALSLLFSALRLRQSLQDPTVNALIQFITTLEHTLGAETFARLLQAAQAVQGTPEQILSRLAVDV